MKLNIQNSNWYCQILDDMCHIYNILFTLLNIKIETNKLTSSQRRIFVSTRVCNCLHNSLSGKFVDVWISENGNASLASNGRSVAIWNVLIVTM